MSELFIECKYIISGADCNNIVRNGAIIVEDNQIIAVGKKKTVQQFLAGHDKLERMNHIAVPSYVNAHTHLPETLLRGICDNEKLDIWLNNFIWPFEMRMNSDDAYFGALLGCLELIEAGVSGFIDQYFYAESIEKAVKESGIRALLCPSVFDNTPESGSLDKTWKHVRNLVSSKTSDKKTLVNYGIGPHAPYTVPKDYLLDIKDLASKYSLPIHIHLNETKKEVEEAETNLGDTPIEYIHKIGLTEEKILGAHCVHTTDKEREIMQQTNITVLHNPQSNLKMTSGIAPVYQYLDLGINVAVGTDGNASNNDLGMIEELTTTAMLQKYLANDPKIADNAEILKLGTLSGMKAMGIESKGISKNSLADITILSLEKSRWWPQNDPLSNVIYSSSSSDVSDLIVNGRIVYLNKKHQLLDKEKIIEKCSSIAKKILTEMGK
jgi:5-methylthioadenosine/S-adenosylhomocysteine deaminase